MVIGVRLSVSELMSEGFGKSVPSEEFKWVKVCLSQAEFNMVTAPDPFKNQTSSYGLCAMLVACRSHWHPQRLDGLTRTTRWHYSVS